MRLTESKSTKMMQMLPIFFLGLFGTFILLQLKQRGFIWAFYLLPIVLFCGISSRVLNDDWRIGVSNIVSMAALFFLPVLAVIHMPKTQNQFLSSKYAILVVGGLTTMFFQYAGLALAFVLGIK